MTDNTNASQMLRTAGECASILKIKEGTLRKYAIELEKAGYTFFKSDRGHRAFNSDDITIIKRFIDLKKSPNMTLERSANAIISNLKEHGVHVSTTENTTLQRSDNNAITQEQMKEFMDQQQKFNKELLDRLDKQSDYIQKQQEYIDKRINQRDKDLLEGIRELQEQKQLAAAKEEEEKEEKKGFFAKLFSK